MAEPMRPVGAYVEQELEAHQGLALLYVLAGKVPSVVPVAWPPPPLTKVALRKPSMIERRDGSRELGPPVEHPLALIEQVDAPRVAIYASEAVLAALQRQGEAPATTADLPAEAPAERA